MTALLLFTGSKVPAVATEIPPVVRGAAYRSDLLKSVDIAISQVEYLKAQYGSEFESVDVSYTEAPDGFAYEDALKWERVSMDLETAPRTYEAFGEKPDVWF